VAAVARPQYGSALLKDVVHDAAVEAHKRHGRASRIDVSQRYGFEERHCSAVTLNVAVSNVGGNLISRHASSDLENCPNSKSLLVTSGPISVRSSSTATLQLGISGMRLNARRPSRITTGLIDPK